MSSNSDFSMKTHVVIDSEEAKRVQEDIERAMEGVTQTEGTIVDTREICEGDGFVDVFFEYYNQGQGAGLWFEALDSIGNLHNGSYGICMTINEYQIYQPEAYGDVSFRSKENPDRLLQWYSYISFRLGVRMSASKWAEVLSCDMDSLDSALDGLDAGLLTGIVPSDILELPIGSGEQESLLECLSYLEYEPEIYKEDKESYESDERIVVIFHVDCSALTFEQLEGLSDALKREKDNPSRPGVETMFYSGYAEERDGACENLLLNTSDSSFLKFVSTWGGINDIEVYKATTK